jgi:hypothetical protein
MVGHPAEHQPTFGACCALLAARVSTRGTRKHSRHVLLGDLSRATRTIGCHQNYSEPPELSRATKAVARSHPGNAAGRGTRVSEVELAAHADAGHGGRLRDLGRARPEYR